MKNFSELPAHQDHLFVNANVFLLKRSYTTFVCMKNNIFVELILIRISQIMSKLHSLKQIPGPDPTYKDICFSGAGRYHRHFI